MGVSSKTNIVVIDPEEPTRVGTKDALKQQGLKNINDFSNVNNAMKYVKKSMEDKKPVELVITDYELAGMNGVEFCKTIKDENPSMKGLKVILVSAQADKDMVMQAVQAGIKNILNKPFSAQDLVNEVVKIFR